MTFPATYLSDAKLLLHFYRAAAVLEKFVAACPSSLDADTAAKKLGMPVMEVTNICRALEAAGLLHPAMEFQSWLLGKPKGEVTLEDVWVAIGSGGQTVSSNGQPLHPSATDLLVSQALIEIQQSVSQLLRQFQLHRVSTSSGSTNAYRFQSRRRSQFNESLEEA